MDWTQALIETLRCYLAYYTLLANPDGPIQRTTYRALDDGTYESSAFLNRKFLPQGDRTVNDFSIFDNFVGQGRSNFKLEAICKAVSEALERWAYYSLVSRQGDTFCKSARFDIDRSTAGFAAYPGTKINKARRYALNEAAERWDLLSWWSGLLPAERLDSIQYNGLKGLSISSPIAGGRTVILFEPLMNETFHVYGFGRGADLRASFFEAKKELDRNKIAILRHSESGTKSIPHIYESRLLFFASHAGFEQFEDRAKQSYLQTHIAAQPNLIVDTEISGPWSQYACVYRCLFEGYSDNFHDETIFMF